MTDSKKVYQRRADYYERLLYKLSKKMNSISNLRLLAVAVIITASILIYIYGKNIILVSIAVFGILTYIYLAINHRRLKEASKYLTNLKRINKESVMRVDGRWTEFTDTGDDFKDEKHNFSYDLDIFGQGSLFQWINSGITYMGRVTLADFLTNINVNKNTILKRQQAISELSNKRWWRHRLQAEGRMIAENINDVGGLISWAKNKNHLYSNNWLIGVIRLLPIVTATTSLMAYVGNYIPNSIPTFLILLQAVLLFINTSKRNRDFAIVYRYYNSIKIYKNILKHFEKATFQSEYLRQIKTMLISDKGLSATKELKRLEKLVDRIGERNNMLFIPINIITLWDYQCVVALERWKSESGLILEEWLKKIGEIEALSSLGAIAYDYPRWGTPQIVEKPLVLQARKIGHPLLTNKQVCNNIKIQDPYNILLVTGSNMSGKSTFLRTIGINLVLAYAGAPVCAAYMKCSVFNIHTCMRISDNLDKGVSSFYGELLRIKEIIDATKREEQVFFLLDEIFKGTNSYDRHIGAKKLIKQLERNGAMGLVSTHDLELGDLEKENQGSIKNYHFQEYYKDGEICFDYKLRPGISKTRNALYLMKMIGIEE